MIDLITLMTFCGISLGLIALPGPNVLVVVSTSISEGKARATQTITGISVATAIQLGVATVSASWFVEALVSGFEILKWMGVAYLIYLAIRQFLDLRRPDAPAGTAIGSFSRGFVVSLTNPKTILFFGAFLPQFVDPQHSFAMQIALLSAIFWSLAALVNVTYMLLAHRLSERIKSASSSQLLGIASGSLYLCAAAALAAVRR